MSKLAAVSRQQRKRKQKRQRKRRQRRQQHLPTKFTRPIPSMPIEVAEIIIDFVGTGLAYFNDPMDSERRKAYHTLRCCALTCRSWRPRSYHFLYRWIWFVDLFDDSIFRASNALINSVRTNGHLQDHIRALAITQAHEDSMRDPFICLLQLTGRLPKLRCLTLAFTSRFVHLNPQKAIQVVSTFSRTLSMLSIQRLSIPTRIFHRLLFALPNLVYLEVSVGTIRDPSSPLPLIVPYHRAMQCRLTCLIIVLDFFLEDSHLHAQQLYAAILRFPQLISSLDTLLVMLDAKWATNAPPAIRMITSIFRNTAKTLRHLSISIANFVNWVALPLDVFYLDSMPYLTQLCISFPTQGAQHVSHVTTFFSSVTSKCLQEVQVQSGDLPGSLRNWKKLDDIFTDARFPLLQRVLFVLPRDETASEWQLGESLPNCATSGILFAHTMDSKIEMHAGHYEHRSANSCRAQYILAMDKVPPY
ncbi:unnamed protein product [Somion occarium]|uniref:F-box domain-containing protein n=1 Tax=Somion occarium TaxID=3059160 RepID=A0ABP1DWW4_9APHY